MKTFGDIAENLATYETAEILLQSIPYDGTSTWGKGADKGFDAFLEAAENMELYDIETDSEVYKKGIHILNEILEDSSPENVFQEVYKQTQRLLKNNKISYLFWRRNILLGYWNHKSFENHQNLSVLHLDAHVDLRASYIGSP